MLTFSLCLWQRINNCLDYCSIMTTISFFIPPFFLESQSTVGMDLRSPLDLSWTHSHDKNQVCRRGHDNKRPCIRDIGIPGHSFHRKPLFFTSAEKYGKDISRSLGRLVLIISVRLPWCFPIKVVITYSLIYFYWCYSSSCPDRHASNSANR